MVAIAATMSVTPPLSTWYVAPRSIRPALQAITERLLEASERGLWQEPNADTLQALREAFLESDAMLEARGNPSRRYAFLMSPELAALGTPRIS